MKRRRFIVPLFLHVIFLIIAQAGAEIFETTQARRYELLNRLFQARYDDRHDDQQTSEESLWMDELFLHFKELSNPKTGHTIPANHTFERSSKYFVENVKHYVSDKRKQHGDALPQYADLKTDMETPDNRFVDQRLGFILSEPDKVRIKAIPKPSSTEDEFVRLSHEFYPNSSNVSFDTVGCDSVECDLRPALRNCKDFVNDQRLSPTDTIFAALSAIQGSVCIRFGPGSFNNLAAQEVLDCSTAAHVDNTKRSGSYLRVVDYLNENQGISVAEEYKYRGSSGQCKREDMKQSGLSGVDNGESHFIELSTIRRIVPSDYSKKEDADNVIRLWLRFYGPLHVTVDVTSHLHGWRYNDGELIVACRGTSRAQANHALTLVGYGSKSLPGGGKAEYWIVKNSWGMTWGKGGYGFLRADTCKTTPFVDVVALPMVRVSLGHGMGAKPASISTDTCTAKGRGYYGSTRLSSIASVSNTAMCYKQCLARPKCKIWSYLKHTGACSLFERAGNLMVGDPNTVMSGPRFCTGQTNDLPAKSIKDLAYSGNPIQIHGNSWNPYLCQLWCSETHKCDSWTLHFETGNCLLKNKAASSVPIVEKNSVSGRRERHAPMQAAAPRVPTVTKGNKNSVLEVDSTPRHNTAIICTSVSCSLALLALAAIIMSYISRFFDSKESGVTSDGNNLYERIPDDVLPSAFRDEDV